MSISFRPAVRESVGLIIGLVGASGGGKTYTAMRLASGIADDKPFAVIDTEAGRAKHYADRFRFDHADLRAPFSPAAYQEAISAADAAKYPVIVVDSFSHEHAGEGGILDMQEAEHKRLGGGENVKMLSWVKPKGEHRRMLTKLLQCRAHLILCLRAEDKIEMVKVSGRLEVRPKETLAGFKGWVPICEKNLPYELTVSILLLPDRPGVPQPIKLQEQHKHLFPLDQPISEESGRKLAEWARGGSSVPARPIDVAAVVAEAKGLSEEIAIADRLILKSQIKGAADKRGIPPAERTRLAKEHLGSGTVDTADISAVQNLLDAVRAWQPKP